MAFRLNYIGPHSSYHFIKFEWLFSKLPVFQSLPLAGRLQGDETPPSAPPGPGGLQRWRPSQLWLQEEHGFPRPFGNVRGGGRPLQVQGRSSLLTIFTQRGTPSVRKAERNWAQELFTQLPLSLRQLSERSGEVGSCFHQWWPQPLPGPLKLGTLTVFPSSWKLHTAKTQPPPVAPSWKLFWAMLASLGGGCVSSGLEEERGLFLNHSPAAYGSPLLWCYLLHEDFPDHRSSPHFWWILFYPLLCFMFLHNTCHLLTCFTSANMHITSAFIFSLSSATYPTQPIPSAPRMENVRLRTLGYFVHCYTPGPWNSSWYILGAQ